MSYGSDMGDSIIAGIIGLVVIAFLLGAVAIKGCEYIDRKVDIEIKVNP